MSQSGQNPPPNPPKTGGSPEEIIESLRELMDELDRMITVLLNRRAEAAKLIGEQKKALGTPVYVPQREADVLRNVLKNNSGPLEPDAMRRIFERVIDEIRAMERRFYQESQRYFYKTKIKNAAKTKHCYCY